MKTTTIDDLTRMIDKLGTAPDGQLDASLSKECRKFRSSDLSETLRFVRDLRDKAARYAGASPFVMAVMDAMLQGHEEETDEQREKRHAELERGESA